MNVQARIGRPRERLIDYEALHLVEELALAQARESFWCYRQYMRPNMILGWWQREVAAELQAFFNALLAGLRPKLVLQSPPQHGKSSQVVDFCAWASGEMQTLTGKGLQTIYTSYSDRLSNRANKWVQRALDNQKYQALFPEISLVPENTRMMQWQRTTELLEFIGTEGYFRNTTVNGMVTGEGLNLGLIDDPIKGRAEASSQLIRDKTWSWLTDDFMTRFSDDAALLMILTRWHLDDPVGRLKEMLGEAKDYGDNGVKLLRYPALAEHDEPHRKKGEPLFPELKSLDFLLERKRSQTASGWQSIYQQSPTIEGGGQFPIEKFRIVTAMPSKDQIRRSVRFWDKAGTEGGGAQTAGVLMHALRDGSFLVSDVQAGHWSSSRRNSVIRQTAVLDGKGVYIVVEQEPGSGGKESAEITVKDLAGWRVKADRVTGSKEVRAEPYAAQVQAGNVALLKDGCDPSRPSQAPWNRDFVDQHETFPNGKLIDKVDASSGAFNNLVLGSGYDASQAWVGTMEDAK